MKVETSYQDTLGFFLRNLRFEHGYTIKDVEKGVGTNFASVSKWETNKVKPSFKTIMKVANFYKVPIKKFKKFYF